MSGVSIAGELNGDPFRPPSGVYRSGARRAVSHAYRQIFSAPGAVAFELAGFVARTAHLATTLSLIFFLSVVGSYGLAGAAAASYALSYSVVSPFASRLADRRRQGPVLASAAIATAISRAGLLAGALLGAPAWALLGLSALSGATMPAVGPLVRARWSYLLRGSPLLHTALSFESVLDEVILVTAPIAVAVLATSISPAIGLVITLVLAVGGTAALAGQRRTQPPAAPHPGAARGPVAGPGFAPLIATFALLGTAQTIIDIGTVAFSGQHHAKPLSGAILATIALASAVSGLWYGSRGWSASPGRRLVAGLGLLAVGMLLFVAGSSMWFLFLAAAVLGLTIAPTVISGFLITGHLALEHRRTEAFTWITAAMGLGISAGSAAAGQIVDAWGTRAAFGCAASCAGLAAIAGLAAVTRLRDQATPHPVGPLR